MKLTSMLRDMVCITMHAVVYVALLYPLLSKRGTKPLNYIVVKKAENITGCKNNAIFIIITSFHDVIFSSYRFATGAASSIIQTGCQKCYIEHTYKQYATLTTQCLVCKISR